MSIETLVPVVVAAIAAIATVATAWISNRKSKKSEMLSSSVKSDSVTRISSIIGAGLSFTILITVVIIISITLPTIIKKERMERHPLEFLLGLSQTPRIALSEGIETLDVTAKAILEGAGPKEITHEGISYHLGQVFFIPKAEWVNVVYPMGNRPNTTFLEICIMTPGDKLTIMGFFKEYERVLFLYEAVDARFGTGCKQGDHIIYPSGRTAPLRF